TSVESLGGNFAVINGATWLLVREFGLGFATAPGTGRTIVLTSDHTLGTLPYQASKGAPDRIVLAAAHELADRGVTANVINPGPVDTGWMTPDLTETLTALTPLGRLGTPADTARLAGFLCSPHGERITAPLLYSNGGCRT